MPNKYYCAEIKSFSKFIQSLNRKDNVYTSKLSFKTPERNNTLSYFCLVIVLTLVYLCSLDSSSYFSLILLYFDVDGWVTTWCSNCCKTIIKHNIQNIFAIILELFNSFMGGGPYNTETCLLICRANHSTGFYMIGTSVMKQLNCRKNWVQILLATGNTQKMLWCPIHRKYLPVQSQQ